MGNVFGSLFHRACFKPTEKAAHNSLTLSHWLFAQEGLFVLTQDLASNFGKSLLILHHCLTFGFAGLTSSSNPDLQYHFGFHFYFIQRLSTAYNTDKEQWKTWIKKIKKKMWNYSLKCVTKSQIYVHTCNIWLIRCVQLMLVLINCAIKIVEQIYCTRLIFSLALSWPGPLIL